MITKKQLSLSIAILLCGSIASPSFAETQLLGARTYNEVGNQLGYIKGSGQLMKTVYHPDGSLKSHFDVLGFEHHVTYDELGAVHESSVLSGAASSQSKGDFDQAMPIVYQHDSVTHRLSSVSQTDDGGDVLDSTAYGYYVGGSPLSKTYTNDAGMTYQLGYSSDPISGRLLQEDHGLGNDSHQVKYTYNDNGLKTIAYVDESGEQPSWQITYHHDNYGRVKEIERSNGYNTYNTFDALGRLSEIQIGTNDSKGNITAVMSYTYGYNLGGNIISMDVSYPGHMVKYQYSYNQRNQLVGFKITDDSTTFPQDQFGANIKSRSYRYGMNNNITEVITNYLAKKDNHLSTTQDIAQYSYNTTEGKPNQLISIQHSGSYWDNKEPELKDLYSGDYVYYDNGQIKQDPMGGMYAYNNRNQIWLYTQGFGTDQSSIVTYSHNSHGLISGQASIVNGTASNPVYSFYKGHQKQIEIQADQKQPENINSSFYINGLASIKSTTFQGQPQTNIEDLYAVQQGNIVATSHYQIEQTQPVTLDHQYLYTPYGLQTDLANPINSNQSTTYNPLTQRENLDITKNSFGYTGQQKSAATQQMTLGGFRSYDPIASRFLQEDTYTPFSKTSVTNTYAYVRGNPILGSDLSGHGFFSMFNPISWVKDTIDGYKQTWNDLRKGDWFDVAEDLVVDALNTDQLVPGDEGVAIFEDDGVKAILDAHAQNVASDKTSIKSIWDFTDFPTDEVEVRRGSAEERKQGALDSVELSRNVTPATTKFTATSTRLNKSRRELSRLQSEQISTLLTQTQKQLLNEHSSYASELEVHYDNLMYQFREEKKAIQSKENGASVARQRRILPVGGVEDEEGNARNSIEKERQRELMRIRTANVSLTERILNNGNTVPGDYNMLRVQVGLDLD